LAYLQPTAENARGARVPPGGAGNSSARYLAQKGDLPIFHSSLGQAEPTSLGVAHHNERRWRVAVIQEQSLKTEGNQSGMFTHRDCNMRNQICLLIGLLVPMFAVAQRKPVSIVPKPVQMTLQPGSFQLRPDTTIVTDNASLSEARLLARRLSPATGFPMEIKTSRSRTASTIDMRIDPSLEKLGAEGYRLVVTSQKISIWASATAGLFYAGQSLLQLFPPEIFRAAKVSNISWTLPCVEIEDYPRFQWRGALLDTARHFMPKEFVKKFIDLLALHKMNSFQWHLTDDQGWRIEIKKYPKLTKIGGWRKESLVGRLESESQKELKFDGTPHGGFYTQDDAREIVEYARVRHINVVPEIEMPGHAQAAIAAYPELGNTGQQLEVGTKWGVFENIFNPKESTLLFLQDVLTEILEIFPSKFVHIGGDEAVKTQWKASAEAQARIKELGLKNEEELQGYFTRRMGEFLSSKGRRLIGWDEILEGGIAPDTTVMSWRGEKGGIAAARAGHDVVMAPTGYTYFDYYQSKDRDKEPLAIGGYLPLEVVYNYEPVPKEIAPEFAKHVLGSQGQLWTEYMPSSKQVEYMAFPRLTALAEVTWTSKEKKNYPEFLKRLTGHLQRLAILDVNYRRLDSGN
jgi:hexosaminidase